MTTESLDSQTRAGVLTPAMLFNGYVGTSVVHALERLGLLDCLAGGEPVESAALVAVSGAEPARVGALLRTAARLGILHRDGHRYRMTAQGRRLIELRGFFTWAVGGYGDVLRQLAPLATGVRAYGTDVRRDEAMVAAGSGSADRGLMTGLLHGVMDRLDVRRLADVGCGDATRLVHLCRRYPGLSGVGVDRSPGACELAGRNVAAAGLEGRIDVVCADVLSYLDGPASGGLAGADAVSSFFMLHDLFALPEGPVAVLRRIREAFPAAGVLLLADTVRLDEDIVPDELPIFSLGFELVHAFMGVPIGTREEYDRWFDEAGLRVRECIPFGAPASWLWVLDPR
jgi:hypothetical protein